MPLWPSVFQFRIFLCVALCETWCTFATRSSLGSSSYFLMFIHSDILLSSFFIFKSQILFFASTCWCLCSLSTDTGMSCFVGIIWLCPLYHLRLLSAIFIDLYLPFVLSNNCLLLSFRVYFLGLFISLLVCISWGYLFVFWCVYLRCIYLLFSGVFLVGIYLCFGVYFFGVFICLLECISSGYLFAFGVYFFKVFICLWRCIYWGYLFVFLSVFHGCIFPGVFLGGIYLSFGVYFFLFLLLCMTWGYLSFRMYFSGYLFVFWGVFLRGIYLSWGMYFLGEFICLLGCISWGIHLSFGEDFLGLFFFVFLGILSRCCSFVFQVFIGYSFFLSGGVFLGGIYLSSRGYFLGLFICLFWRYLFVLGEYFLGLFICPL